MFHKSKILLFLLTILAINISIAEVIPKNSYILGNNWYCSEGFKKRGNSCQELKVPGNAYVLGNNWYCSEGFKKRGNSCQELKVPENAYVLGNSWYCSEGFKKRRNSCQELKVPENAYVLGNSWYCSEGFKKRGNSCQELKTPENGYVLGNSWYCSEGFKKRGGSCQKLIVPTSNYSFPREEKPYQYMNIEKNIQYPEKNKYKLNISVRPKDSIIKIMNIRQIYKYGMKVNSGKYKIFAYRKGYKSIEKWIKVQNQDFSYKIILDKKNVTPLKKDYNYLKKSSGTAPCSIGDGYQTVQFNNGASYSGYFKNCRPVSGKAHYYQGDINIKGYSTPINNKTVILKSGRTSVTITLQIERKYSY